jgi:hypothetical protein
MRSTGSLYTFVRMSKACGVRREEVRGHTGSGGCQEVVKEHYYRKIEVPIIANSLPTE